MPVAVTSRSVVRSRLDKLPNEILEAVLELLDGPASLYALVSADCRAKELFLRRPRIILRQSIKHSAMKTQLQKMLCTIISIRHRKSSALDDAFQAFVHSRLDDQSTAIDLDFGLASCSDPIKLLKDTLEICDDLSQAEKSLIRIQSAIISERVRDGITQAQPGQGLLLPVMIQLEEHCPSRTELHRIRRAFWRLRLYLEAFYEPYVPSSHNLEETMAHIKCTRSSGVWDSSDDGQLKYIKSQKAFFSRLTVWELEELECAWYHLSYQSTSLWRRPCPTCGEQILPDDLVRHIQGCTDPPNWHWSRDSCFAQACSWFRMDVETFANIKDLAAWPDALGRELSAGFKFFEDRSKEIHPDRPAPTGLRGPHSEFLQWGYCIWDQDRLEAWHLVDHDDQKHNAVLNWWSSDQWKRHVMLHSY